MRDFDWTSFTLKIAIRANLETIYNAWTIPSEIEKWFLKSGKFYREKSLINPNENINAGDEYKWEWFLYDITEEGKVLQANGRDHLRFTFAGECIVDINLYSEDGYTIVHLRQYDIPTDDHSKKNIRIGCHSGWSFYLVNLKSCYENAADLRNRDDRFTPMVNN